MMKRILPALILTSGLLTAETFENIAWEFPPAKFEWKLLLEDANFKGTFFGDDLESDNDSKEAIVTEILATPVQEEALSSGELTAAELTLPSITVEEKKDDFRFQLFTHREGDAMELFTVQIFAVDKDEEDEELDTLENSQKQLDESINKFFPHFKMNLLSLEDNGTDGFIEWELTDGIQGVMHGLTRAVTSSSKISLVSYMTTAVRTEYNTMLWKNALNQAKVLD